MVLEPPGRERLIARPAWSVGESRSDQSKKSVGESRSDQSKKSVGPGAQSAPIK